MKIVEIQEVIKNGELWARAIDDNGVIVYEGLLHDFEAEPVQPTFELPVKEEERHKLSKKGKFTIAAIAGGALVTAVIVVRRHKRHKRA